MQLMLAVLTMLEKGLNKDLLTSYINKGLLLNVNN
jgi:hypothetical protein